MTVVFTAILGASDSLKPAPKGADRCVCFVDDPSAYPDPHGWELVQHSYRGDARRAAWRLRCVPHWVLGDHDRSIWIDASFTLTDLPKLLADTGGAPIAALRHHNRASCYDEGLTLYRVGQARFCDVEPQLLAYRRKGFKPTHLSISCIIVRQATQAVARFNETWASEIETWLGDNTQVSLDYSAWVNGLEIAALEGTRHKNPYSKHDHLDHKKRRRPYWVPA